MKNTFGIPRKKTGNKIAHGEKTKKNRFFRVIGSSTVYCHLFQTSRSIFLCIIITMIKRKLQLRNSSLPGKVGNVHLKRQQAHIQQSKGHKSNHHGQQGVPEPR